MLFRVVDWPPPNLPEKKHSKNKSSFPVLVWNYHFKPTEQPTRRHGIYQNVAKLKCTVRVLRVLPSATANLACGYIISRRHELTIPFLDASRKTKKLSLGTIMTWLAGRVPVVHARVCAGCQIYGQITWWLQVLGTRANPRIQA